MKLVLIKLLKGMIRWGFRLSLLAASLGFLVFSYRSMVFFNAKKNLINALVRMPASEKQFQVVVMRAKNPTKLYYPDGTFLSDGTRGVSLGARSEVLTLEKGQVKLATPAKITLSLGSNSRLTIGEPEVLNEKKAYEQFRIEQGTLRAVVPEHNQLMISGPNLKVMATGPSDFLITHDLNHNRYHLAVLNGHIDYYYKEDPKLVLDSGKKISFASGQNFAGLMAYEEELEDLGGTALAEVITKQDLVLWLNKLSPAENPKEEQHYLDTLLAHINYNQQIYAKQHAIELEQKKRLAQGLHPVEKEAHSLQMGSELLKDDELKKKWMEKTGIVASPE